MLGDELRLKHQQTAGTEWTCVGFVIKIPDSKIYILNSLFSWKYLVFLLCSEKF